jgi:hypothetical protein
MTASGTACPLSRPEFRFGLANSGANGPNLKFFINKMKEKLSD